MPIMDGYEATRLIRESENSVPIVAMSANVFEEEKRKATDVGVNDFIDKPIVFERFVTVLKQFLEGEGGARLLVEQSVAAVSEPSEIAQDLSVFSSIRLKEFTQGDERLQHKLVDRFISESPKMIQDIETSLDFSEVERLCHTLKSMSASIGGQILAQHMATMEQKVNQGESVLDELAPMREQHSVLIEQLKHHMMPTQTQVESASVEVVDHAAVEALSALIDAYDSQALAKAEELFNQTANATLNEVKKSLEQYDFDNAKQLLRSLLDE